MTNEPEIAPSNALQTTALPRPTLLSRRSVLAGSAALAASGVLALALPTQAHADDLSEKLEQYKELAEKIDAMRTDLEKSADEFYKAMLVYDAAEAEVAEAQEKIDATNVRLSRLQTRLSERMKVLYKNDGLNLISVLFGATSFRDFTTKLDMLDRLNDADASLAAKVRTLSEQNVADKRELEARKEEALKRLNAAQEIQEDALKKSAELEELYASVSDDIEAIIGADQAAALAAGDDVTIIGNPRNIEPHPEVVEFARSRIGCPYVWAAAGPSTFDCSGLVVWVFDKAGIPGLPHYTESLYGLALAVGAVLPLEDVEPGDVLYRPGHVGIAAGHGGLPYIHAPYTGALVRDTDSLAYSRFVCGLRFPGANALSAEELAAALASVNAEIVAAELAKEKEDAEAEEAAKKEAEEKKKAEEEAKAKKEAAEKEKAEAEAKAKADADAKAKAEAEEKERAEAEEKARAEAEAKEKAEAKAKAEAEAKAEQEARERAEAEEKARREAEKDSEEESSSSEAVPEQ